MRSSMPVPAFSNSPPLALKAKSPEKITRKRKVANSVEQTVFHKENPASLSSVKYRERYSSGRNYYSRMIQACVRKMVRERVRQETKEERDVTKRIATAFRIDSP